jgi:hypothetical protein
VFVLHVIFSRYLCTVVFVSYSSPYYHGRLTKIKCVTASREYQMKAVQWPVVSGNPKILARNHNKEMTSFKTSFAVSGRTALVTGVSPGGIGVHTAIGLCKAGAHVVLSSRDRVKAEAAAAIIRKSVGPDAVVQVMELDLASLVSIRKYVLHNYAFVLQMMLCGDGAGRFADDFAKAHDDLAVLVNNAGIVATGCHPRTKDGFDETYGVCFIGTYYLTTLLLPLLKRSAPSRIVSVG